MAKADWMVINGVKHYPVLWREITAFYKNFYEDVWKDRKDLINYLATRKFYLADGTFGGGNHSKLLLDTFPNIHIAGREQLLMLRIRLRQTDGQ